MEKVGAELPEVKAPVNGPKQKAVRLSTFQPLHALD